MTSHTQRIHRRHAGFTLIEIILVMVIILTLVGIVGPRIAGQANQAKVKTTKIQMNSLKTALQQFEVNASRFPTTSEGLNALIEKPGDLSDDQWPDSYLDQPVVPQDGWHRDFEYKCPSEHGLDYDLASAGRDGQMGTDDDISNWKMIEEQKSRRQSK